MTPAPRTPGRVRELATAAVQYGLLFGFAAVAAGISATGLTGFARDNMQLAGRWPYLVFLAFDGAAAMCAVLAYRRAARAESALLPRLAVWGLVSASAWFNAAHAPPRPGAVLAYALMPLIAAVLWEFALHETRHQAGRADRRIATLRWLHPIERIRVQLHLAACDDITAAEATRQVRITRAALRLHRLRLAAAAGGSGPHIDEPYALRMRRAERRAQAALDRAGFTNPDNAAAVLACLQVRTQAKTIATLDLARPDQARAVLANMLTTGPGRSASPVDGPAPDTGPDTGPDTTGPDRSGTRTPHVQRPGHPDGDGRSGQRDDTDIEAAALAVLATEPGISGAELGRRLHVSDRHGRRLRDRLTGPDDDGMSGRPAPGTGPDLPGSGHHADPPARKETPS